MTSFADYFLCLGTSYEVVGRLLSCLGTCFDVTCKVLFFVAITRHIMSLADCFQSAYKMLYNLLLYYISSFSRTQSKVLNSNNFGLILNLFSGLCWGKKQPPKCTIVGVRSFINLHHPDLSIHPRSTRWASTAVNAERKNTENIKQQLSQQPCEL